MSKPMTLYIWEGNVTTRRDLYTGTFFLRIMGCKRGSDIMEVRVYHV